MAALDRRGVLSLRALLLVVAVFGIGFLVVGPLRSWAQQLFAANNARGVELSRRVQAQHLEALRPQLNEAGIEVEAAPAPAESAAAPVAPIAPVAAGEGGWLARAGRWWRQFRGIPEPLAPASTPVLADSLGLRPGERMFLPNGRMVQYDSSTMRVQRGPGPVEGH
jgi:hypothetical protein